MSVRARVKVSYYMLTFISCLAFCAGAASLVKYGDGGWHWPLFAAAIIAGLMSRRLRTQLVGKYPTFHW